MVHVAGGGTDGIYFGNVVKRPYLLQTPSTKFAVMVRAAQFMCGGLKQSFVVLVALAGLVGYPCGRGVAQQFTD